MTDHATIEVPLTRPMIMSANDRYHWAQRSRKTRRLRKLAWATTLAARTTWDTYPARVVITYHYPTRRRPSDEANLAPTTKALVDGLTDAGLWPDDSTVYVRGQDTRIADEPTRDPDGRILAVVSITPA